MWKVKSEPLPPAHRAMETPKQTLPTARGREPPLPRRKLWSQTGPTRHLRTARWREAHHPPAHSFHLRTARWTALPPAHRARDPPAHRARERPHQTARYRSHLRTARWRHQSKFSPPRVEENLISLGGSCGTKPDKRRQVCFCNISKNNSARTVFPPHGTTNAIEKKEDPYGQSECSHTK